MKSGKPLEDLSAPKRWKLVTLTTISILLVALSVTPVFIDPVLASARYALRIAKGTVIYDLLASEMPGALVEVYVFNITNIDKFQSGEDQKLKLDEIGPFTYQEYRKHDNFFLDEKSHTLRYTPVVTPRFLRQDSVADPKDVNVTVSNVPLLTLGSTMGSYPYWTQMGFNFMVDRLNVKPVINLRAHDFLWGYRDSLIALGNTLMPGWINFDKLGMMDRLYDPTLKDTLIVDATDADKFRIRTVNGEGGILYRGYVSNSRDRCNTFVDTYEGLVYPPGLTPNTKLRLYRNVFCRILDIQYVGTRDMEHGHEAYVYRFSNTTFNKNSDNQCLCGKICIDGMTDLSPCFYGFGVSFSQAHLLDVDPKLYERIEGIKPDFDKHGSEFIVDPNLGAVMNTKFTVQLNLVVDNAEFNARTRLFSHMIIPVLYFRIIQPELPDETKKAFRNMYMVLPYILLAVQVALLLIAVVLLAFATRFVRFAWFCKKVIGSQANTDKTGPVYEEPLIERTPIDVAEIISDKQAVDKNDVLA